MSRHPVIAHNSKDRMFLASRMSNDFQSALFGLAESFLNGEKLTNLSPDSQGQDQNCSNHVRPRIKDSLFKETVVVLMFCFEKEDVSTK